MGKPIVATDADGLLDILSDGHDALIVPKRDPGALAEKIVWAMDHPDERRRLSLAARVSGRQFDIAVFVRKMEQLYGVLHDVSRATRRRGVLQADLSFLTSRASM
jgi:glycosyltransferase involved in cell wall biosynthesis